MIGLNPPPREHFSPAAEKIQAGNPTQWVENAFDSPDAKFSTGVWHGEPGRWRVSYTEHELCVILKGRVVLTGDDGSRTECGPGQSFVVPGGFTGTWENLEPVEKIYAIYTG